MGRLAERGVAACSSPSRALELAAPFGAMLALALAPALLPSRRRALRAGVAACATRRSRSRAGSSDTPISDALLAPSQPERRGDDRAPRRDEAHRLPGLPPRHLKRCGLMFDPRFVRTLTPGCSPSPPPCALQGGEPLLARLHAGRASSPPLARCWPPAAASLIEREAARRGCPGRQRQRLGRRRGGRARTRAGGRAPREHPGVRADDGLRGGWPARRPGVPALARYRRLAVRQRRQRRRRRHPPLPDCARAWCRSGTPTRHLLAIAHARGAADAPSSACTPARRRSASPTTHRR